MKLNDSQQAINWLLDHPEACPSDAAREFKLARSTVSRALKRNAYLLERIRKLTAENDLLKLQVKKDSE